MAVLLNIAQQTYTPRTQSFNPVLSAGRKSVVVTLTRVAWPAGAVGSVTLRYPNGDAAGGFGFVGGAATGRDGLPMNTSRITVNGPGGGDLPSGTWSVDVEILQTVTTAVLVEAF